MVAVGIAAFAVGCGGTDAGVQVEANDEPLIRQYLQQTRGLKFDEVVFKHDLVVVDHDVVLQRSALLDEIAEVGFEAGPGVKDQGYYYTPAGAHHEPQVGPGTASTGHYVFTAAVPETWRASFRQAFAQWSNAGANDCVKFTEGAGGPSQVTISVGNAGTADDGKPAEAISTFPSTVGGIHRTGLSIVIGTPFVNESRTGWRLHTALHEIGHTLGFTHPWNGEGSPIPGTTLNTANNCPSTCSASYFTVMDYFGDTTLSLDDTTSLAKVFVKRGVPAACNY